MHFGAAAPILACALSVPASLLRLAPSAHTAHHLNENTHIYLTKVGRVIHSPRMGPGAETAPQLDENSDTYSTKVGRVIKPAQSNNQLIALLPHAGPNHPSGTTFNFESGGRGAVLFSRCGVTFATQLEGPVAKLNEQATVDGDYLVVSEPQNDDWPGSFSHLGHPLGGDSNSAPSSLPVFGAVIPQSERAPISQPLHTGVVAIDALAPLGRGQSMLVLGPDGLPPEASRSSLARRILAGSKSFSPDITAALVLRVPTGGANDDLDGMRHASWFNRTKILFAENDVDFLIAAHSACSLSQAQGRHSLVVVDSLEPLLRLWRSTDVVLHERDIQVRPEEEGSHLRAFYASLTERANRKKAQGGLDGGSTTLLLLQPSASTRADPAIAKKVYEISDFVEAGFSQVAIRRLDTLVSRGVPLTATTLEKLAIPAPGSGHPRADGGRRAGQHTEELTSLSDGHIELSENLASIGRMPPIDPAQSLTRIGIGTTALRPVATTLAMRDVTRALRLDLASAADPVHCEDSQRIRATACTACLHQPNEDEPLPLGEQVALLLASTSGLIDSIAAEKSAESLHGIVSELASWMRSRIPGVLSSVSETEVLSEQHREDITRCVRDFMKKVEY